MRILHLADIHLDRAFGWLGRTRGDRRRGELRAALSRAIDRAIELRVDAIGIAGDLFDAEKAGDATGDFLRHSFARFPGPVLVSPGNHDPFRPGCLYDRVPWSANVRIFRDRELTPHQIGEGWIWGRAFRELEDYARPLAGFQAPEDGVHLGLIHADIVSPGIESRYAPIEPGDIFASGLAHLMLGHIHAGRVDPAGRCAYSGSIEPLDIGETGSHWALLIDARRDRVTVEPLQLAQRQQVSETIDVTDVGLLSQLRDLVDARRPSWQGNNVSLRIVGVLGGELLARPEAIDEALAEFDIGLELSARPAVDYSALAAQQTTLGAFVRVASANIARSTNEQERRDAQDVLATGVAAFFGQEVFLG